MNEEQQNYINKVGKSLENQLLIKHTGREGINLMEHFHEQYQIIFTLQGTLHIFVDGIEYFIPEYHICWIPARIRHTLSSNNKQISLVMYYVPLKFNRKDSRKKFAIYNTNEWASLNLQYIGSTGKDIIKDENPDLFSFGMAFFRMLPVNCHNYELPLKGMTIVSESRLQPAMTFINQHLDENILLEDVAQSTNMAARSLSRLFNQAGIRFSDYLKYLRITRAIELISDGELNIRQIAYATGFSSPSNFNRTFKQVTGKSPTQLLRPYLKVIK